MNTTATKKSDVAQKEEHILSYWQAKKIFEQSMSKEAPLGDFVFYDGPPFATGLPHYGHLLAGTIKDIIPRYKTMRGYRVPRKWGWDCHGLPIENLIEKELGLATKKDIEEYGIEKFNQAARDSVLRYESDWKKYVPRSGRWIDMDQPYMSMQSSYMESVWWIFKQLHEKGLTKEGFKSMHLCPRCETTLANFEVNQGYKDVTDISVTAQFELIDEPGTFFLAWTTTPWTLPANVALAVGKEITYVKVQYEGSQYIVAEQLLASVFEGKDSVHVATYTGQDLLGMSYKPVFEYYQQQEDLEHREQGWKVYAADFVTTEDGTGIVHVAPGYGADDLELAREHSLPFIQHVGKNGEFRDAFAQTIDGKDFAGMMVKKKDDYMSIDIEIIKYLAHAGTLFAKKKLVHSYPHCWRCDTPLLNYATGSWYVDVPKIQDQLVSANQKVHWVPEHVGDGRFGKWLEGARDWALSRSRFWGTPLPVWRDPETDEVVVFGSVEELLGATKRSGNSYFALRHGESESNISKTINADPSVDNPLTELGKKQVIDVLKDIPQDIDMIFVSPLQRTRETAEIIKDHIGLSDESYIIEPRLSENNLGASWEGRDWSDYHNFNYSEEVSYLDGRVADDAESMRDVYTRVMDLLFELEETYADKKILMVSHGGALRVMQFAVATKGMITHPENFFDRSQNPKNAKLYPLAFVPFPHNEGYELDLHRPYIDSLELLNDEGKKLSRVEDVFDVWFDSGSMPYAQVHYPFENSDDFIETRFPAQYIAEGLDQTRGWFYVLSVLGIALFDRIPFENVIVNGLILAEDGKKMSKKLKNYPDPQEIFDTLGADALRLYLLSSPAVRGEEFAFSQKAVREVGNKVMGRLRNILSLYMMYQAECEHHDTELSDHVLDVWIYSSLNHMKKEITQYLDSYALDRAARCIFDFVDDFSTWYIRRSRDRFKGDDNDDKQRALATTLRVLKETAQVIAPFVPFVAEEIWQSLKKQGAVDEASVHLSPWPELSMVDEEARKAMHELRELISQALQLRSDAKIKVRQVLASVSLPIDELDPPYQQLIRDELNVQSIFFNTDLAIDTVLTPALIQEGRMRELLRALQNLRKEAGLDARDEISLSIDTSPAGKELIEQFRSEITKIAGIAEIRWEANEGSEISIDDLSFSCQVYEG